MELETSINREEFNRLAALTRDNEARRTIAEDRQRQIFDSRQQQDERDLGAFAAFVEATRSFADEIEALTRKLERLETASVQALMQNEVALRAAQEEVDKLLAQAHVLSDGRRVFRTEDGKRVFDEHGQVVSADTIDPEQISAAAPSWEKFDRRTERLDGLSEDRRVLIEYQHKIDHAQERIAEGGLNADDLAALDAMFEAEKPAGVRAALNEGMREPLASETMQYHRADARLDPPMP